MVYGITLLRRELACATEQEKGYEYMMQENGRRTVELESAMSVQSADLAASRKAEKMNREGA